jgi:hypothetical protein
LSNPRESCSRSAIPIRPDAPVTSIFMMPSFSHS